MMVTRSARSRISAMVSSGILKSGPLSAASDPARDGAAPPRAMHLAAGTHWGHAAAMLDRPSETRASALREVLGAYAAVWVATFPLSQTEGVPILGEHRGE